MTPRVFDGFDDYKIVLYRNQPTGWVAEIAAIPGCHTLMPTREEALAELTAIFLLIMEEYRIVGNRYLSIRPRFSTPSVPVSNGTPNWATIELGAQDMIDWSQCPAVESIPGKVSGAWVLKGTRTPVKVIFENLEAGMSIEEVMEQFPVTREQIDSLMAFVAKSLDKAPSYA